MKHHGPPGSPVGLRQAASDPLRYSSGRYCEMEPCNQKWCNIAKKYFWGSYLCIGTYIIAFVSVIEMRKTLYNKSEAWCQYLPMLIF